jgi:hypothetical protein
MPESALVGVTGIFLISFVVCGAARSAKPAIVAAKKTAFIFKVLVSCSSVPRAKMKAQIEFKFYALKAFEPATLRDFRATA